MQAMVAWVRTRIDTIRYGYGYGYVKAVYPRTLGFWPISQGALHYFEQYWYRWKALVKIYQLTHSTPKYMKV